MTEKYTVSLFGHRIIEEYINVESKLYELLRIIMNGRSGELEFLVGRNGDFDLMAASVIRKLKKETGNDNVFLTLVLPYETAELRNNTEAFESYYDSIEICDAQVNCKYAIIARNEAMVDRADLVVVCVKNNSGGAYRTLKYAEKNGKRIINLIHKQN